MFDATKRTIIFLSVVLLVAGCQNRREPVPAVPEHEVAGPTFDAQEFKSIPAEKGRIFWIDSKASDVRFFLWRGGPLAAKGHNHVMMVRNMDGAVFLPDNMLEDQMRFDIVFPVADIEVDPYDQRKNFGEAFSSKFTAEEIQGTREHMLGEKVLDAERFPRIGLSAVKVYGELPKIVIDTAVTLHGVQRRRLIPVTVSIKDDRLFAMGSFAIEQTDFGIVPFSVMGGALSIQDPIMIEFAIIAYSQSQ